MKIDLKINAIVVALLMFVLPTFSQKRSVDIEIICVSPADTVVNGIGERLRFGMQNNGPDTMYNQDSILYELYVYESDSVGYRVYSGMVVGTSDGTVPIGDARYYNDNYAIRFPYPDRKDTFTVEFCVAIGSGYYDSEGQAIHPFTYIDPNPDNNFCCTQVTIIPKPLPSSIFSAESENALQVYPNPVRDVLHIRTPVDWNSDMLVSLWDISGRRVLTQECAPGSSVLNDLKLDVSALPEGMYQVRVQSAEGVVSEKVVVRK